MYYRLIRVKAYWVQIINKGDIVAICWRGSNNKWFVCQVAEKNYSGLPPPFDCAYSCAEEGLGAYMLFRQGENLLKQFNK
jgi:hypothetical protein